jgi:hypothetical protein
MEPDPIDARMAHLAKRFRICGGRVKNSGRPRIVPVPELRAKVFPYSDLRNGAAHRDFG